MQLVACLEQRRQGTFFGASAVIASAEHNRGETLQIARCKRRLTGQPNFDDSAAADMHAMQAGRQSGRIVGYYKITGLQELRQLRARRMANVTVLVDV
jgi:aspartate/methionine/tyrosine aminotransferase